jgi:hypothetical protein
MAAGAWVVPDLAKLNFVSATDLLSATAANFRLALVTSAWTPVNSSDELWAVASANEIANGNGYTTGGLTPATFALTNTSGVIKFTWSTASVWTATGTGIPAWRRAVLYYLGTLNGKVNPLVAHFLGDSTPADVPLTTSGNTLTITPNASGVLTIT